MKQLRLLVFTLAAGIIGGLVLVLLVPVPSFATKPAQYLLQIGIVSSFSLNFFAAAILFVYGMRDFKPEMKRSYRIITWSMAYLGVANLQYPILVHAGLIPEPWTSHGGSFWAVAPGMVLLYIGVRHFAKALGVSSWATSVPLILGAQAALSVLSLLPPHSADEPQIWYAFHQTGAVFNMVWSLSAAAILVQITRAIGRSYVPAIRWLWVASLLRGLGFLHIIVAGYFGVHNPYNESGPIAAPFIITALFYVVAGYYFCKVRFFGQLSSQKSATGYAMLDAVMNLMGLVSNRQDIAGEQEQVRVITAQLKPGQTITPADQQALVEVYLQLEEYLINRERLKLFTHDGLRARLSDEAAGMLSAKV